MVSAWFRDFFAPTPPCSPLCRAVEAEVESIGRAAQLDETVKRRGAR